ncbi:c-type cytochrome [Pseudohalocynthiibacter aestuariivivens]|jgi:mono/diheme cytochrome c family protein|uniref:C-type cytochrome n=1 Tax=Pseudohalocynthiibacter aestuariivivens TaxID=1591409 RepID=A0ABV5JHW2_9RHOB|nr:MULTISPECIES: cytochrome c [Pseudohalocynthiibacter]MBS9717356.1 hypothetical protein [Pseudohalocynthiibacter aestuariivivens]MCK0102310.1 cytochrome c [Pseudohalocynthiibacter sp. F2068]
MRLFSLSFSAIVVTALVAGAAGQLEASEAENHDYSHGEEAQMFVHGAPENPTDAWTLAAGGRIYDNWWVALDRDEPEGTHPSYPATGKKDGSTTWRCKECHGWDYLGAEGVYRSGSHFTGIKGISEAIGMDEAEIATTMRAPTHGFTAEMISDEELARLAAFVSRGQIDMANYVDLATREIIAGDPDSGRAIFQTTCAVCHGFDGRSLDWGDEDGPAYVGTEAVAAPDEVMNKILNAHPGVEMINLRVFGPDVAGDVLSYIATLPQE